ncbi:DUF4198 domain-containing protein [Caviibacter abscessus]|uniref:DUF4198 domain-containing protein n=1 Tax=Caviibacter abscessus TaxID=1766719 RepID=UPI0008360C3C|nr:DUF4198 domain-containing protein [Caviibacter abscessus]
MKKTFTIISALVLSSLSFAHFQMINTKTLNVDTSSKSIPFDIIFTHPASNGHTMDIGKNKEGKIAEVESFVVKKGEKLIDAKSYLVKSTFGKTGNKALSYKFTLDSKTGLRGSGTYVLIFNPAPYYEKSENIYIKQATKVYLQRGEIESEGWNEKQSEKGTPEILPYINPTKLWKGQIFRGQVVDGEGNPVPNAEIEVEYRNYNVKNGQFTGTAKTENSENVIFADKNGMFEFVLTEKGQWGFAALGASKHDKIDDVEVSYDAVLWVEAK